MLGCGMILHRHPNIKIYAKRSIEPIFFQGNIGGDAFFFQFLVKMRLAALIGANVNAVGDLVVFQFFYLRVVDFHRFIG